MIEYFKGAYGLNTLLRVHGSATYRGAIPGALSAGVYMLYDRVWNKPDDDPDLNHPYAIGILVSSVSFLIIFRANYGYQRYWEACSAVHHMMSKWMDSVIHTGVFHLQCSHYDRIKPPNYFDHPELNRIGLTRDREKRRPTVVDGESTPQPRTIKSINAIRPKKKKKESSIRNFVSKRHLGSDKPPQSAGGAGNQESARSSISANTQRQHAKSRLIGPGRLDGGWGLQYDDEAFVDNPDSARSSGGLGSEFCDYFPSFAEEEGGFANRPDGKTPSLFLQELAHLASLCAAVAMSTLRNDIEGAESPLDMYTPGAPWPVADPDKLPSEERNKYVPKWMLLRNLRHWFGMDRTPQARTLYNATRPLLVIGGVSDNEIAFLQRAKGPSAKTTLAWSWLSEFIIREHLAGSLGKVGPPIVSRIIQFLSDGMIYYNHARKIMYIPFPFPHAQLSAFFVLTMIPVVPFLMDQYTNETWLGALLSFLTVTCLAGLHEVARELENPFRNAPNDIPLCTLQAMFNESLITMYSGYHPDFYWDPKFYATELEVEGNEGEEGKFVADGSKEESMPPPPPPMPTQEMFSGTSLASPLRSSLFPTEERKSVLRQRRTSSKGSSMSNEERPPSVSLSTVPEVASTIVTPTPSPKTSSSMTQDDMVKHVEEVVAKQSEEIERLKKMVEEDADKENIGADTMVAGTATAGRDAEKKVSFSEPIPGKTKVG